jgi:hypothetical protein
MIDTDCQEGEDFCQSVNSEQKQRKSKKVVKEQGTVVRRRQRIR